MMRRYGKKHYAKIIHTYHGFGFHDFQNFIVRKIYVLVERLTEPITDQFIAVSHDNVAKGVANGIGAEAKYTVIRSGIKISLYQNATDAKAKKAGLGLKDEKIVGMVACFKGQKSPLDFIRTAAIVCARRPGTKFVLVGDGALRPKIEALIKELNLSGSVMLTGWRDDIPELMKIFDVFVLTSLYEGLPKVVVEAMAAGIPVVATYVDGTKEIIREGITGFFTSPHENEKTAERVLRLLNDTELRAKFSSQSLNYVAEFDIDLMVRQQEKLYGSLTKPEKNVK
jgi:glycosyltransferase involved in cell wall biosynthesis